MSFEWPSDDIVAGLKIVCSIWQDVTKSYHHTNLEAIEWLHELFDAFRLVSRLDDWNRVKDTPANYDRLPPSRKEFKAACTVFIKRHMHLIQQAIPMTKATRPRRSNWLQMAPFTKAQAAALYHEVNWAAERKEIHRLHGSLQFLSQMAILSRNSDLG
jgi:hypothetical protein